MTRRDQLVVAGEAHHELLRDLPGVLVRLQRALVRLQRALHLLGLVAVLRHPEETGVGRHRERAVGRIAIDRAHDRIGPVGIDPR